MYWRSALVLIMLAMSLKCNAGGIRITRTTCELRSGLVATDVITPRLGWQMVSDKNGTHQSAYEINIYNMLNGCCEYTSGKVMSDSSQLVPVHLYEGKFQWNVRAWDENDVPSEWSDMQGVIIENPDNVFGAAKWIGAMPKGKDDDSLSHRSIILRKDFKIKKKIKRAFVNVCGLGFYELSINGHKVDDAEFAPLWSNYDKSVFYNTYDVTHLLQKGGNAIGALLGNGFYKERGGRYHKLLTNYGPLTLRLQLEIVYEGSSEEEYSDDQIVTDSTWQYALSPITFNSIYGGEDYDARLEIEGWNRYKCKLQKKRWHPVVVQQLTLGTLRPQMAEPVKIMETYGVKSYNKLSADMVTAACKSTKRTVDSSAFVLDMGQNIAGYPQITVSGRRGEKITLLLAETLTGEGACNQSQTGRPHYYVYTLKGDTAETWHPRFAYYGFQFIQVEGAVMKRCPNPDGLPVISNIHSCFVYNSSRTVSTFECSNDLINKTHRLIDRAVRSNMQSVFTDCPHREKLGWLEQDYLNGPGLVMNYDLAGFIPQTMQNIADAQLDNGAVPTTAPEYVVFKGPGVDVFRESPEWGGAFVYLPLLYFQKYHDNSLIHRYYPQMKHYLEYLGTRAKNYVLDFGLGDWYDYGPGRAGFSKNTPVALVATAHYYYWAKCMKEAAAIVGQKTDVMAWQMLSDSIMVAFNREFYHAGTCQYGSGSQTSNAIALVMGLCNTVDQKAVVANLMADIKSHGNRLTTGDVGNRFLFEALSDYGMDSLLYVMLNHYDVPGYGYQIKQGATTLTEQWDPQQGASRNHFMMGQIDEFFFKNLAGIPGFRPRIVGDITHVSASTETPFGRESAEWTLDGDTFKYKIHVPLGESADVMLPGETEPRHVGCGNYSFVIKVKPNINKLTKFKNS